MSAVPQTLTPRKPIGSEGQQVAKGYFPARHEWTDEVGRICGTLTEALIVWKVLSLANKRNLDGRSDGWTGPLTSVGLAQVTRTTDTGRMVNIALKTMIRRGVMEQKSIKDALAAKILETGEAPKNRLGFVLRCRLSNWAKCPDADTDRPAPAEKSETSSACPSRVLRLHDEPIVLMPGQQSRPIPLSVAVRRRLAAATTIEPSFAASFPVQVDLQMVGDVLRWSIADAPASSLSSKTPTQKGESKAKPIGNVFPNYENKGLTGQKLVGCLPDACSNLQRFLNPTFVNLFGKTLDSDSAERIAGALGDCPVDAVEGYSFASYLRKRLGECGGGAVKAPYFVKFAEDANRTYRELRAQEKPAAALKAIDLMSQIADTMLFLRESPKHVQAAEMRAELKRAAREHPAEFRSASEAMGWGDQ